MDIPLLKCFISANSCFCLVAHENKRRDNGDKSPSYAFNLVGNSFCRRRKRPHIGLLSLAALAEHEQIRLIAHKRKTPEQANTLDVEATVHHHIKAQKDCVLVVGGALYNNQTIVLAALLLLDNSDNSSTGGGGMPLLLTGTDGAVSKAMQQLTETQ
jgi:hypothetical protein